MTSQTLSFSKEDKNSIVFWKVTDDLFCDWKGMLVIKYMEKRSTIIGEVYGKMLQNLKQAIKEKRLKFCRTKNFAVAR